MKQGGKRSGSGRKKLDDKKKQLAIYVKESRINKIGKAKCKKIAYESIEDQFNTTSYE